MEYSILEIQKLEEFDMIRVLFLPGSVWYAAVARPRGYGLGPGMGP